MKKSIYIAGKVTGMNRHEAIVLFEKAELKFRKNYRVVNPTKIVPPGASWPLAMRQCLGEMLACDVVYFLSNWQNSKGAKVEHDVASICGMQIQYEVDQIILHPKLLERDEDLSGFNCGTLKIEN